VAYLKLKDNGIRIPARIDWLGNAAFAVGLVALLTGIIYSLLPYGGHPTGWTNPWVLLGVFGGIAILGLFVYIETKAPSRCSASACSASGRSPQATLPVLLGALGRGGLQFMLIIWLQGSGSPSTVTASARPRCGPVSR